MNLSELLHLPLSTFAVYAIPFLVGLTIIVFIHELGHFLMARWCGVDVEAFSIGFGREIFGWNDRKGTRWKVAWLPLGGYVRFRGDANAASLPDAEALARAKQDPGNFHGKPVWQRAAVVAAGPIANFILAIAIFAGAFMIVGRPVIPPRADVVLPGSAAEKAGIRAGDMIVSIDGARMRDFADMQMAVMTRAGEALTVELDRNGERLTLTVVPQLHEEPDGFGGKVRKGLLGVKSDSMGPVFSERLGPVAAIEGGIERTWFIVHATLDYVGKLFTGRENADQLGGPISIAKAAGDAASGGFWQYIMVIAFLSVSIGLLNLFPIPMLDGGHLVYYAVEAVRGKPLGENAQEWGFRIGFSLVIMLMLVGTMNDIMRVATVWLGG
ncbi:MAG: RIP metalloprotease RseP [Aestuariivirga sp.]|uniref:RIP metalloprotease RseP n=1 Tax=Aestuariivirga sp. TaxID=2650926 RepID=UPI0025BADE74|nr:RIP metalloprotease RseP [Aestuariivirga sp.]MCA3562569.1 RIP metalloprotease RseP [Aestuariivirga sp.]